MTLEDKVKKCLKAIVDNRHEKSLNYAVNYAKAGLGMTGHELYIQCLYVLSNMSRWRGDQAKEVRSTLKTFTKIKETEL